MHEQMNLSSEYAMMYATHAPKPNVLYAKHGPETNKGVERSQRFEVLIRQQVCGNQHQSLHDPFLDAIDRELSMSPAGREISSPPPLDTIPPPTTVKPLPLHASMMPARPYDTLISYITDTKSSAAIEKSAIVSILNTGPFVEYSQGVPTSSLDRLALALLSPVSPLDASLTTTLLLKPMLFGWLHRMIGSINHDSSIMLKTGFYVPCSFHQYTTLFQANDLPQQFDTACSIVLDFSTALAQTPTASKPIMVMFRIPTEMSPHVHTDTITVQKEHVLPLGVVND
jgi:hypothetical protein